MHHEGPEHGMFTMHHAPCTLLLLHLLFVNLLHAECEISGTVVKIMKENGDAVLPGRPRQCGWWATEAKQQFLSESSCLCLQASP